MKVQNLLKIKRKVLKKFRKTQSIFGFYFTEQQSITPDEEIYKKDPKRVGPEYLIGRVMTAEQVETEVSDRTVLMQNMRINNWTHVVQTRLGNFQPLTSKTVVLNEKFEQVYPLKIDFRNNSRK